MNNFTTNTYEMKREILNFSKKVSEGVNKATTKFVMDMQYGLAKGGSCLISSIARSLDENIKLNYTIDRLCDNLSNMYQEEKEIIWNNYLNEVSKNIDKENAIVLFDDSDINKEYSKKLEDLDRVIDGSSQDKKIVNGYHVCEATVLSMNNKQPMSIYSKIYSCKSKNFVSKNTYTLESIKAAENMIGEKFIGVFDRGYDDNKIFKYMSNNKHEFVVRLDDERILLFKGKKSSVGEVAKTRKGKISYKALFDDSEEYELMLSYTKATLPANKEEYTLVIVYGLSEKSPMKLLTNINIKDKADVIKVVRLYLSRWRIEEHFRGKKQEYDFENMRVRTLESMNTLNMMLTIHLGHIAILADKIDKKLLTIKILYASKSLKDKSIVWLSQIARGIKNILAYAHTGIRDWLEIETREKFKQLELKL
ncbi:MAG: transposase [Bacilli bacterium]|nr:transposase [Bacilli bacterium]